MTTQFGAIWGDNFYFTSKQGNRLVVADARTLKRKAVFTEIGGDGRAFVGLTDRKAYVGHNRGIAVFDIPSLTITRQLEGISSQTGDMRLAAGKVFVVNRRKACAWSMPTARRCSVCRSRATTGWARSGAP